MSVRIMNWAWHDPATQHLRGNAAMALLALADIADDEGHVVYAKGAKRSQEALARKARMSVATFRRVTSDLVEQGFLEVTRESHRSENEYRVIVTAQVERSQVSGQTVEIERSERSQVSGHSSYRRTDVRDVNEGPRKRGSRIPDPFVVTAEMRAWAAAEVPGLDVDAHTREFVDHWRAETGAKASKLDWISTWRNWMRKAHRWSKPRGPVAVAPVQRAQSVIDMGAHLDALASGGVR